MAGDWIKMRMALSTHPKVIRMATALRTDTLHIVGALHAAWSIFDTHSIDGRLDGYTPGALDQLIGLKGFSHACAGVGWLELEKSPTALVVPRFTEHNGQSAKRRAQDAARKRDARTAVDVSASDAEKKRIRKEKSRDINTPLPPVADGYPQPEDQKPNSRHQKGAWRWNESWEGYVARGIQLGVIYSEKELGNAWTDDEKKAHRQKFKVKVEAADRDARGK